MSYGASCEVEPTAAVRGANSCLTPVCGPQFVWYDSGMKEWKDHPENPLIEPPWPEFLLGDPCVVLPEDSPDGAWHMFANTLLGIHHFTGSDGIHWKRQGKACPGMRAYVFKEGGVFYMFTEDFRIPMFFSRIVVRTSSDLAQWSDPVVVLEPELRWEKRLGHTTGNPCLIKTADGYRLYYSAGLAFFGDLGFCEPMYIGAASADSVTGPFRKYPEPIISPSEDDFYRSRAAGAIKVIYDDERKLFYGFNNGMYRDIEERTRSAILLLESDDGLEWEYVYPEPIIAPGGAGWKKALVYQLDVKRVGDEMWLWYNARSGWRFGKERIGLATCPLD